MVLRNEITHNMRLLKTKIEGFKNISGTSISYNHINALVALNNYGKSNTIHAIDFANAFIQGNNKVKSQMMQDRQCIPINNMIAGKNFEFELTYESLYNEESYEVNYSFSFEWIKKGNEGKKITRELLKVKKNEKDSRYTTYINRTGSKNTYQSAKTGRCDKNIIIDKNALIVNKLLNFDDLFYLEIIKDLNSLNFSFYSLNDIDRYFSASLIVAADKQGKDSDMSEISNISKRFYLLKEDDSDQYNLLINTIQDLLPDIEYITPIEIDLKKETEESNGSIMVPFELPEKIYDIRIKIKTNNQETSVKNLSVGSKRIFYILLSAIMADMFKCMLLTFEELENSIHPALLQRLLIVLSDLAPNTKILITSHSPHMVRYLNVNDILIGVPNQNGISTFAKVKKSKQKKLVRYAADAESNIGDFIFDMLIESYYDDSFFNDFI